VKLPGRLWLISLAALAALLGIGLLLQLLNQLVWQLSAVLPYGLVGPVLLVVLALMAAALVQLLWPWIRGWWRERRLRLAPPEVQPPLRNRREAAARNLEAIDRTLEQVRDAVAREALRQERQRMAEQLERGDLVVVLFGSGSVGKTSLIRALLRQLVGTVGAPMGSTDQTQRYRLRIQGLQRCVWLVDTPGILEAGSDGHNRERLARQQAARADLLLLLLDGDLRAAEQEVFSALAGLGKRLLLVLNKCDLRGEREEERLLALLRQRGGPGFDPADLIAVSAAPQSVPQPGQRPLQPPPEVGALLRRIAQVLHADGEELIADNLLLQSRELGQASRDLLASQRRADGLAIVDRYMWIGAGVLVATPLPGLDLLGTAAVNAQMVIELARLHGIELGRDRAQELALSVGRTLAGLGMVKGGVSLLGSALTLNLPALLASRAIQAVSAAWLTRVAGLSFLRFFERDQDWGDGGIQQVVQEQYALSRRESALSQFLAAALTRVVTPLQQQVRSLPPRPRD
jgi:small GTP-binding protein